MKKVLIIPLSVSGHIIPTFQIAKSLIKLGSTVCYLIDSSLKNLVQEQGFDYTICPTLLFHNHGVMNFLDTQDKTFFENLLNRLSNNTLKSALQNLSKFEQTIEAIAPDEILLDSFLSANYILMKNKRPTIFIQTMVSTYQDMIVPPLSSRLQNKHKFLIQLAWLKYKYPFEQVRILSHFP